MPSFGEASRNALESAHPKLRELFNEVIKTYDCKVLCGFRSQEDQQKAFDGGFSKVQWPNSKHNTYPSLAVDVAPYPVDWQDLKRFYHFGGYVRAVADRLGIKIRQGFDWNGNFNFKDESFLDAPHVELVDDASNILKEEQGGKT